MTHAGTIDLGGSAQSKQGGSPWAAIAATLALVLAMMGAVWFASNAGLVGGTAAKPVEDRSYDQIEAHRGATTPITVGALEDRSYDQIEAQRGAATPITVDAVAVPPSATSGTFHATPITVDAVAVPPSATSGTFHATPITVDAVAVPPSATSGTFHAGNAQLVAQAKRDRVGGP